MTATQNETAVATRVQYQPLAPVGSPQALKSLLETQREGLSMMLPKHVTPERVMKTMLVAANRIPDLLKCTQASILETINRAGELGLDLSGTLGEAYPVPFNNRVGEQWLKQCQLIIGYRGLAKLARQSGEIANIQADIIYSKDQYSLRKGASPECWWQPNLSGDRGDFLVAVACVTFKDGTFQFDYMNYDQLEAIRKRSKSGADKNGNPMGPWKTDWEEMAKKTVFRRLSKWLPLSAEKFTQALEHDNETDGAVDIAPEPAPTRLPGETKSDAVLRQIAPEPEDVTEPAPEAEAVEPPPSGEEPVQANPLVSELANKEQCTLEEAEEALRNHCRTSVWACDLEQLNQTQVKELGKMVKKGEIKV